MILVAVVAVVVVIVVADGVGFFEWWEQTFDLCLNLVY